MFGIHKNPFNSRKKKQSRLRREKTRSQEYSSADSDLEVTSKCRADHCLNCQQPVRNLTINHLKRHREFRTDVARYKKLAQLPIQQVSEECLEISIEQIHRPNHTLDIPKRPSWTYGMASEEIEQQEQIYFNNYLEKLLSATVRDVHLGYFDMNLDRWRQLWRTVEVCDIILMVVDIRFAVLHFCPSLHDYVTKTLLKPLIIILNKIDLAPPSVVIAIQDYFTRTFPQSRVIIYTSYTNDLRRTEKNQYSTFILPLLGCISSIIGSHVDLSAWKEHIQTCMHMKLNSSEFKREIVNTSPSSGINTTTKCITLGFLGCPNVGKTTIVNNLLGRRITRTERTKHLEMTYLMSTIRLCDCPGIIFPSCVERPLQILAGTYPIDRVKQAFSSVIYLAQCLPLTKILQLNKLDNDISNYSAMDICEAWALKRRLFIKKTFRPDVHRAADHILRLALHDQINLCFRPPGFIDQKEQRKSDVRTIELNDQMQSWIVRKCLTDESDDSQAVSTSDNYQFISSSESVQ